MPNINQVTIAGHLGKDAEHNVLDSGLSICNLSVATSKKKKNEQSGKWETVHTEWHNVACFNFYADKARDLKKGHAVFVQGEIKTDSWQDKESGETKYRTKIMANHVSKIDTRKPENQSNNNAQQSFNDDSIPF